MKRKIWFHVLLGLVASCKSTSAFAQSDYRSKRIASNVVEPSVPSKSKVSFVSATAGNVANGDKSKNRGKRKSRAVTLWVHAVSIFLLANYRSACWPAFLIRIPLPVWNLVHSVSGMLFSGSVITTTILEWTVVATGERDVSKFWFEQVPKVEKAVVLPALTGSMISGVAQAFLRYESLRMAPRHIKSTMHLLFLFGIWWGVTDRHTQSKAQQVVEEDTSRGRLPGVLRVRRISNVVSCLFLVVIYAIMVLKPGYVPAAM